MADGSEIPHTTDEPDPELVELMRERVVRRKSTRPKNPKPGPGRPKGSGKVPGSGRKAGTPNLMSPEFRAWLAKRAKPFELLAKICRGSEIVDGGEKRRPTLAEQMRAAETIGRKILPDLQASKLEASGPAGGPLEVMTNGMPDEHAEIVRRFMFFAEKARRAAEPEPAETVEGQAEPAEAPAEAPEPEPTVLPVGHEEQMGSHTLRLAERLPDGRERWTAADGDGHTVAVAFGRDRLVAKIEERAKDGES